MKRLPLLLLILLTNTAFSQVVYENVNNTGIYEFLDEMANLKAVSLNSVIKPYSRDYIAGKLFEALGNLDRLNKRQKKELNFYLQDYQMELSNGEMAKWRNGEMEKDEARNDSLMRYDRKLGFLFRKKQDFAIVLNPLSFSFRDRLFRFSVRPILGMSYAANENGSAYQRYWGGSMFGYIGKNFGFYASIRDNNESIPLAKVEYLTPLQGNVYKYNGEGGVDFAEMKGGISVAWNWGNFGLFYDRIIWGNNYNGANIISSKAPPFPFIQLHLNPVKWFDFNYIHGWLNSNIIDSSRSYYVDGTYRQVFRNKYIAANMFTFIPWKGLHLSFGNSIIYSDINIHPVYLIPFMFFNAVDATKNAYSNDAGSNSQLFFDVSCRQIKHLHVWVSLFVDELRMSRVLDKEHYNFTSWKAGFRLSDFPLSNLSLTAEWTKTNPMTYKHYIPATTFASSDYCMGHYLRDNSQEVYISLMWKPLRGLQIDASYTWAVHGGEYSYTYENDNDPTAYPVLTDKTFQTDQISLRARYEYTGNGYFYIQYLNSHHQGDVGYSPEFMHGNTNTIVAGVNLGF